MSLMRNFDISPDSSKRSGFVDSNGASEVIWEVSDGGETEKGFGGGVQGNADEVERINLQNSRDLSPEALKYIQKLESELSAANQVVFCFRWCYCLSYSNLETNYRASCRYL